MRAVLPGEDPRPVIAVARAAATDPAAWSRPSGPVELRDTAGADTDTDDDVVRMVEVDPDRLPRAVGRGVWRSERRFAATPDPLLAAWRVARQLTSATVPGDLVVCSDAIGLAGMFALEQAGLAEDERRRVIVVAGQASFLSRLDTAGTLAAAFPAPGGPGAEEVAAAEHRIDWEIAACRWADRVVTAAAATRDLLATLGVSSDLLAVPAATSPPSTPAKEVRRVWLPEPFSRASRSPAVLRAVAAVPAVTEATIDPEDVDDGYWSGTSWEAAASLRATVTARLRRGAGPEHADVIVLGDPHAWPSDEVVERVASGVAVLVPPGSAAAARWPDAPTWTDELDLAAALTGQPGLDRESLPVVTAAATPGSTASAPPQPNPDRARRISVGVPVFRDVRHLDDCLRSLLAQSQPPHEILLLDDGSRSDEVTRVLEGWAERQPGRVRALAQPNLGVCVARNRMLEEMTGDAFVFVDQDDELDPDFLAACAGKLRGRPDLTAVATWTEFFGAYQGIEAKPAFDARVGRRENPIVSTCVLIDMAVRDAGIRFAPDLAWLYCEDWDLWARIVAAGGRFGLVPQALARHRVHPSSGGHHRQPLALAVGSARARAHLEPLGEALAAEGPLAPTPGPAHDQDAGVTG